jgi:hypothetical protein
MEWIFPLFTRVTAAASLYPAAKRKIQRKIDLNEANQARRRHIASATTRRHATIQPS